MIITNITGGSSDILCKLSVYWPSGWTCTATCGSSTLSCGTSGSTTLEIKKYGTWVITAISGSQSITKNIVISAQSQSLSLLTTKAFSACTWDEINQICNAGYASVYIANQTWAIGDVNANATYGSYSGVRLVHVLTDEQRGSVYYNTEGHIVVEFQNTIINSIFNDFWTSLTTVYDGLNSDFADVIKTFTTATSTQSRTSEAVETSVEYVTKNLQIANCKEMGLSNSYRPSENDYSFAFTYYNNGGSRNKTGINTAYWLRSPSNFTSSGWGGGYYNSYFINSSGSLTADRADTVSYGLAPIAVI